jgi:aminopeptidase-like protein
MSANVLSLVRKLYPYPYSVTGKGNDEAVNAFLSELPFSVHAFASGAELNGWLVAPDWRVSKAEIRRNGDLIYDGLSSPLGVITLSTSFRGRVSLAELRKHLYFSDECPDAVVYHWTALYRPSERSWGFCIPRTLVDQLEDGDYAVEIVTEERPGTMKVLDHLLPGELADTILLNAHNCHPFQANDDISGCAVGIRVMQALSTRPRRRFSYRLVIAPELIGTSFWLERLGAEAANLRYTVMLKSVGNPKALRLQESFTGVSRMDLNRYRSYDSGPFRTIYGNDETVFEAPGYEIPSISLTRYPFTGYHTNLDTPDTLSESHLQDAVDATLEILDAMEKDIVLQGAVKGLVALSHPRYNLYRSAPAPGIEREEYTAINARWNLLMNCLSRHLDGKTPLLDIADRHALPIRDVHEYVMRWVDKGLASVCNDSSDASH